MLYCFLLGYSIYESPESANFTTRAVVDSEKILTYFGIALTDGSKCPDLAGVLHRPKPPYSAVMDVLLVFEL